MFHLSIAWFALLLAIGATVLIKDQIKYLKYKHEREAKLAKPKEKELVPHAV